MTESQIVSRSKATEQTRPIRVLLVDDHALFRRGIVSFLASQSDIEVVGECGDGQGAKKQARELQPDLILMDLRMPGCDGIEATRLIKAEMPSIKIIALTVSEEEGDLFQVIRNGAQGYLVKNLEPEELFRAIRGTIRGEAAISPQMAAKILNELSRQSSGAQHRLGESRLTRREKEVLSLLARGISNREISNCLCISESTARNHLHSILEKLHLHNRVQAAIYAKNRGLTSTPSSEEGD